MSADKSTSSRRQQRIKVRRQQAKQAQQRRRITSLILVAAGAIVLVGLMIYPSLQPVSLETPEPRNHPMADFNAMGDPSAPVVVEEYSDFQCSHCADFSIDNAPIIIENYVETGQVYFIYNSFGNFMGEDSSRAAEGAYCAGDQGKFWEMHDYIFVNQTGIQGQFSVKNLTAMADAIGLDVNEFEACLDSGKFTGEVVQDGQDGEALGVTGTPAFFINGTKVSGNDINGIVREIEAALAAQQ